MQNKTKRSTTIGVVEALCSYIWWGVVTAVYYKWLDGTSPLELVAWRVIAGLPVALVLVLATRSMRALRQNLLHWANLRWLLISSTLILTNWYVFVWAVANNRLLDASLGYYLNPLVSVALGAIVLHERLSRMQWVAVWCACAGVIVFIVMVGTLPWIALVLGITFPLYGLVRKQCPAPAEVGLATEMIVMAPMMLALSSTLFFLDMSIWTTGTGVQQVLIFLGGIVTVVPLVLYTAAARRLHFSTVGMLQYIAPTCQFMLAALLFHEDVKPAKLLSFGFVWVGIVIYSFHALASRKNESQIVHS